MGRVGGPQGRIGVVVDRARAERESVGVPVALSETRWSAGPCRRGTSASQLSDRVLEPGGSTATGGSDGR